MHTSTELLDLAKERLTARMQLRTPMTDYGLGMVLEIRQQTISNWRRGRSHIDTAFADKIADAAELPGPYVLACIESERESNETVRGYWQQIASAFPSKAATLVLCAAILAAGTFYAGPQNSAVAASLDAPGLYIIRTYAHSLLELHLRP